MEHSDIASSIGDVPSPEVGRIDLDAGQGQSDLLEDRQTFKTAVFGVVYTLSKEKYDKNAKFSVAKILLDFLQLLVLIVHPNYGWSLRELGWIWSTLSYFDFTAILLKRGYNAYLAALYVAIAALVGSCGLCFWVGWCFKNDHFPYIWPIKMLRFVVSMFFVVFYISSLNLMLMAVNCNFFNSKPELRWKMIHFQKDCLRPPHMVHAAIAALMAVIFTFVTTIMTLADFELNPISRSLLASPTSMVELRAMLMKTALLIASSLLDSYPKLQAILMALQIWLLAYSFIIEQPHYNKWINHLRASLYGSLSWAGLLLLVLIFSKKQHDEAAFVTFVMLAGFIPSLLVRFLLSYLRLEFFCGKALRGFRETTMPVEGQIKSRKPYKFSSEQEVELLSRCCRKWIDDDTLDDKAVKLSEAIIKAGLSTFSNSAALTILHSNFLIEVQNMYQSGHSQLQAAKKFKSNICQKFSIFIREQEHRQKSLSSSSGESAVDLVSYVEFQRNYRQLIRSHRGALYATRSFWRQLLHQNISFIELTKTFALIDQNQSRAERTYKTVLDRYPKSPKLLRSYAKFLEFVKNDPWSASRYYSEADKLEEETETSKNDAVLGNSNGEFGADVGSAISQVHEKSSSVVLCNASGVIQMANKVAHKMFGYRKGEMEGKNVSMLMPTPVAQLHNSYLRAYLTTGKAKLLNTVRDMVALHKNRFMFAVRLAVTKVSGSGNDSIFMAILLESEDDPSLVRCWCSPTGHVVCIDKRFTDWFGKDTADVVGQSVNALVIEQGKVEKFMTWATSIADDDPCQRATITDVSFVHKYTKPVKVNITCSISGEAANQILILEITRSGGGSSNDCLMVADQKGNIAFATSNTASLLGYSPQEMVSNVKISDLMNAPFSQLHSSWLKSLINTLRYRKVSRPLCVDTGHAFQISSQQLQELNHGSGKDQKRVPSIGQITD